MSLLRAVDPSDWRHRELKPKLVVISNREPYSHEWLPNGTCAVRRPASGLVTGIEPLLATSGGTWIAHATGSADHAFSSADGRIAVPPGHPSYTLRRLWLRDETYQRYYAGMSNEGLWPLCHTAFVKPVFRRDDWSAYRDVNDAFARAAVNELSGPGTVLVQDYHFALVPDLIRRRAPLATTSLFWHIPWPAAERLAIFPWKQELLRGMLGADVVGFHTMQHCLNFIEAAHRYLGCRIDTDAMIVRHEGRSVCVRPYPISVEWPYPAASREAGREMRGALGIRDAEHVSIAVDRIDYTKGLLERIAAIERLLENRPSLWENYALVQLASPSRTSIREYQQLAADLTNAVARVNERFQTPTWKPVHLLIDTRSPEDVRRLYAMADSAIVTPLHDGMNLVAKEYVAACEDSKGVLILSEFAGAARELAEALVVNPFDLDAVAAAISRAVDMPPEEKRRRMQAMRGQVATHSIHDWSRRLLHDMTQARRNPVSARSDTAIVREELAG